MLSLTFRKNVDRAQEVQQREGYLQVIEQSCFRRAHVFDRQGMMLDYKLEECVSYVCIFVTSISLSKQYSPSKGKIVTGCQYMLLICQVSTNWSSFSYQVNYKSQHDY